MISAIIHCNRKKNRTRRVYPHLSSCITTDLFNKLCQVSPPYLRALAWRSKNNIFTKYYANRLIALETFSRDYEFHSPLTKIVFFQCMGCSVPNLVGTLVWKFGPRTGGTNLCKIKRLIRDYWCLQTPVTMNVTHTPVSMYVTSQCHIDIMMIIAIQCYSLCIICRFLAL